MHVSLLDTVFLPDVGHFHRAEPAVRLGIVRIDAGVAERDWVKPDAAIADKRRPCTGRDIPDDNVASDVERRTKAQVRLRQETTMTLNWIAARLQMGNLAALEQRLYLHRKSQKG